MKRLFAWLTLRTSLLLLVLLAILPAMALLLYSNEQQHNSARQMVNASALALVNSLAAAHNQALEGAHQTMQALAELPEVQTHDTRRCNAAVSAIVWHYPIYANLAVADANGAVFCDAFPLRRTVNLTGQRAFRRALAREDFATGGYETDPVTGKPSLTLAYPILDSRGHVDEVIVAGLNPDLIARMLLDAQAPVDATLLLVDSTGTVISRYPVSQRIRPGQQVAAAPVIGTVLHRETSGTVEVAGLDGVRRLYAFTPLLNDPASDLYLLVGLQPQQAYAAADRAFRKAMLGMLLTGLAALGLAWLIGYTLVLQRIRQLVNVTHRWVEGQMNVRTNMSYRGGEIGELAHAFDQMGEALQEREEQLRLLQSITAAVSTADDLRQAFTTTLKLVCEATGWAMGQAWTEGDGQELCCVAGWPAAPAGSRSECEGLTSRPGQGLVGKVWVSQQPLAVAQTESLTDGVPLPEATAAHLQSALAFPVTDHGTTVAVVAFFTPAARPQDKRLRELIYAIASQLGGLIQRKRAEDRIRYLAFHDPLSGLPNRAWLEQRLQAILQDQDVPSFALLDIEIKRLKEINSTMGFANGDQVISQIGSRLAGALDPSALLVRLSGNLFSVVLLQAGEPQAVQAAGRLLGALEQPFAVADLMVELSALIGIALYPQHGTSVPLLVQRANAALSMASITESGYAVYTPRQDPYSLRRLTLLGEFRRAIRENQLLLYVQPKANIHQQKIAGAEALVRWHHPQYQLVSPDEFIPYIEKSGLIMPLSNWMINESLKYTNLLQQAGYHVPIAVNLSAHNLQDRRLAETINQILDEWRQTGKLLELEVTESSVMQDPVKSIAMLKQLHDAGFHLFIDDFGTGYSSLSYLTRMPFNAIKIDQSFVRDMVRSRDSYLVVRAITELGHSLGLKVVAEGVATREIWDKLAELGCDEAQGSYVSPPMPVTDLPQWLEQTSYAVEKEPPPASRPGG
jgi:diguanylate cyclase